MTPARIFLAWLIIVAVLGAVRAWRRRDPRDIEGRLRRYRENDGR